jgi:hypothetical protein
MSGHRNVTRIIPNMYIIVTAIERDCHSSTAIETRTRVMYMSAFKPFVDCINPFTRIDRLNIGSIAKKTSDVSISTATLKLESSREASSTDAETPALTERESGNLH